MESLPAVCATRLIAILGPIADQLTFWRAHKGRFAQSNPIMGIETGGVKCLYAALTGYWLAFASLFEAFSRRPLSSSSLNGL